MIIVNILRNHVLVIGFSLMSTYAFADQDIAMACTKLLESKDAAGTRSMLHGNLNFYEYSYRDTIGGSGKGYKLLEDKATDALLKFYKAFYRLDKKINPTLSKNIFCDREKSSLNALQTTNTRPDSRNDCLNILTNICKDSSINLDSISKEIKFSSERNPWQKVFDEFIKFENNYLEKLNSLELMDESINNIVLLFPKSNAIKDTLSGLFNIIPKLQESARLPRTSLLQAHLSEDQSQTENSINDFIDALKNSQQEYKNYLNLYTKLNEEIASFSGLEKEFLQRIAAALRDPAIIGTRYAALFKEMHAQVQSSLDKTLSNASEATRKFVKFINN